MSPESGDEGDWGHLFWTSGFLAIKWLTAKLLLALASTLILGSEYYGTHDHILLSDGSGSRQTLSFSTQTTDSDQSFVTTDGQSTSLSSCQAPNWGQNQIFITPRQLRVWWCGAPFLTRGRVCGLQLLLGLASGVILESESRGTQDRILLSQIRDSPNLESQVPVFISPKTGWPCDTPGTGFPFSRLLRRLSRWRYSNPPPRGELSMTAC
jgi:hypothetical protein